jgi:type VI secretion system ImpM family protein
MEDQLYKIRCFGKLPSFDDFISLNTGTNELVVLDRWIQEAYHLQKMKLQQEFKEIYSRTSPVRFVFQPEYNSDVVIGCLYPSKDRTGREFPFLVVVQLPFNFFSSTKIFALGFCFNELFEQFDSFYEKAKQTSAIKEINEFLEEINFPSDNIVSSKLSDYEKYINEAKVSELWNKIFDESTNFDKLKLFYNLSVILDVSDNRLDPLNFSLGLSFPISTSLTKNYEDISFWLNLCYLYFSSNNFIPFIFWSNSNSEKTNRLLFFTKQPSPSNLFAIINKELKSDNICEMDLEGDTQEVIKNVTSEVKTLIDDSVITVKEFLRTIKK